MTNETSIFLQTVRKICRKLSRQFELDTHLVCNIAFDISEIRANSQLQIPSERVPGKGRVECTFTQV